MVALLAAKPAVGCCNVTSIPGWVIEEGVRKLIDVVKGASKEGEKKPVEEKPAEEKPNQEPKTEYKSGGKEEGSDPEGLRAPPPTPLKIAD